MVQTLAWVFGVVLTLVGVLGFVPGITSDGMLLGIFMVDGLHSVIHLVSGLAALAAAWGIWSTRMYFQVFGVIYGLVTVIGFLQGDTVLGLIGINMADNVLHLLIAAVALYAGFGMKEDGMGMSTPRPAM
ncbi:MAG: hypothetical protein G01um10148_153 [Parcubacteria group bacterium Gr01-1014_8]|nr:MAG: hypothetical protein G01um10148_153 [Parcubacteria group bacterium Gr01-1014_8]